MRRKGRNGGAEGKIKIFKIDIIYIWNFIGLNISILNNFELLAHTLRNYWKRKGIGVI